MGLQPRLIPILLLSGQGLVKTANFQNSKYIGDPLNTVKLFNELLVDELMLVDIDATSDGVAPNFELIERVASVCNMPLTYCGGVKKLYDVERIISLGVEKVGASFAFLNDRHLLQNAVRLFGSQSIVGVLDIKKSFWKKSYSVFTHNGTQKSKLGLDQALKQFSDDGIGEIVVNSIDNEGQMKGYDFDLLKNVFESLPVNLPITFNGGCGSFEHIRQLWSKERFVAAGVGSFFVFQGKYKAVLIQYPDLDSRHFIYESLEI